MILTKDIITKNVSILSTVGGGGRWRGVMFVTLNGCAMECLVFRVSDTNMQKAETFPSHSTMSITMLLKQSHSLSHIKFIPLAYDSSPSFNIVIRKLTH
jgi:hypothetical protein